MNLTKTCRHPIRRVLSAAAILSVWVACTRASSSKVDLSSDLTRNPAPAVSSSSSLGSAASQIPLSPSAAAPAGLNDPNKPNAISDTTPSPAETAPDAAVGQTGPVTSGGNTSSAHPIESADQLIFQNDPNRFKFAFFSTSPAFLRFNDFAEGTKLAFVFTQDADFCKRKAAPLHVQELITYQYIYPEGQENPYAGQVFNISTWPDYKGWFGPFLSDDDVSKFDDPNFIWSNCTLTATERGGRSFSQASWALNIAAEETFDTATSIPIDFHARNQAQEVAWSFVAKKCDLLNNFLDNDQGNHPKPVTVSCAKNPNLKKD